MVTPDLREALKLGAHDLGVTVSSYVRMILRRVVLQTPAVPPSIKHLIDRGRPGEPFPGLPPAPASSRPGILPKSS